MMIRALATHDLAALLDLYKHLHVADDPTASEAVSTSTWNTILNNDDIRYFGAFDGTRLVSCCNITVIPNLTRGCKPYALIENVVTHADYRRRGFGHAMLKAALDFAWSRQCYKVMLMTGRLDAGTFGFYESAGFKRHEKEAFVAKPEER